MCHCLRQAAWLSRHNPVMGRHGGTWSHKEHRRKGCHHGGSTLPEEAPDDAEGGREGTRVDEVLVERLNIRLFQVKATLALINGLPNHPACKDLAFLGHSNGKIPHS